MKEMWLKTFATLSRSASHPVYSVWAWTLPVSVGLTVAVARVGDT